MISNKMRTLNGNYTYFLYFINVIYTFNTHFASALHLVRQHRTVVDHVADTTITVVVMANNVDKVITVRCGFPAMVRAELWIVSTLIGAHDNGWVELSVNLRTDTTKRKRVQKMVDYQLQLWSCNSSYYRSSVAVVAAVDDRVIAMKNHKNKPNTVWNH